MKTAVVKPRFVHGRELREVGSVLSVAPAGARQLSAKGLRQLQGEVAPT